MKLRTRLLTPLAVTAALIIAAATPAHATVNLTAGHADVIDVDWTGSALNVNVLDATGSPAVERAPGDVTFAVPAAAKITVPGGGAWGFLGTSGSTVWALPQSQTEATNKGILWPGWNTDEVNTGVFTGDALTFKLKTVSGPGNFSIYTVALNTPTVLFNSGDGLPDTQTVLAQRHRHANWAFTAAGTYTITFEVYGTLSGGGTSSSGDIAYTFNVTN